jgi:hypothetical protein
MVVLAVVAVLLVGGGVTAAVLLTNDSGTKTQNPATSQPAVTPPAAGPSVQDGVTQIATILDLSQQGRTLTEQGRYAEAIANRQKVLDQVDGLTVVPELELSRTLLRRAVQASIDADQALLQCTTCASTDVANQRATALKDQFVLVFNPFATKYIQRSFDSHSL